MLSYILNIDKGEHGNLTLDQLGFVVVIAICFIFNKLQFCKVQGKKNQATNALNVHRLPLSMPAFPNVSILNIVLFIFEADELRFKSITLSSIHFFSL